MSKLFATFFLYPTIFWIVTVSAGLIDSALGAGPDTALPARAAHMDLAVSFDLEHQLLYGTAKIELEAGKAAPIFLTDLIITAALMSTPETENAPIDYQNRDVLQISASDQPRTLLISYQKKIANSFQNIISEKAVILTSGWHPMLESKATFTLAAHVPPGFTALSQADQFEQVQSQGYAQFSFSQPLHSLTFAAARYVVQKQTVRDGLTVYTMFFEEDQNLAADYLDYGVNYINRYEQIIGPFPYNHYIIAENVRPTGYGFPTFTLLGQQVIRLPFIKQTSLGHEILHSWFGNNIDVSPDSGNWSEGLTTYLADMAYRTESGEGPQVRKEAIQTYSDYIDESAPPLNHFLGAGHDRRTNQATRAVGYQRSAMLFHELQNRVGPETFYRTLRRFNQEFSSKSASWKDLQDLFEQESEIDLNNFFSQRLVRLDLPELEVADIGIKTAETTILSFSLLQKQSPPYELYLPITVKTLSGTHHFQKLINTARTEISLSFDSPPLELIIDQSYDILRTLSAEEDTPRWSRLLGSEQILVILADESEKDVYEPFLKFAERYSWPVKDSSAVTDDDLEQNSLIFLGTSGKHSRSLFATPPHPKDGFTLDVRVNPLNLKQTIALISSSSKDETQALIHRLPHYGKYSYLHFQNGNNIEKRVADSSMGIRVELEKPPGGIAVSQLLEFDPIVDRLAEHRVVYVGETHNSRPDHLLQMMLIEALFERDPDLAIGMEMFPRTSQPALDRYITDSTFSESDFIRESKYYEVWRYDYRLFRPIFNFARKHKIPIIGLNVDREIVSSVFKEGTTESLSLDQKQSLPTDRQLDMAGYIQRLSQTHEMHGQGNHADGSLGGFIQAQALWDETMAESISTYLEKHPTTRMIVLAGSQHSRKDSGIPPRVARRLPVSQASVVNLATSSLLAHELAATADYLFFLQSHEFSPQGKIGVVLQERQAQDGTEMEIVGINQQSNAIAAGIQEHDIVFTIDGMLIKTMDDIRLALLDKSVGELLPVKVRRTKDGETEEISLEVKLYNPALPAGHP